MKKKILAILLSVLLIAGITPMAVFAGGLYQIETVAVTGITAEVGTERTTNGISVPDGAHYSIASVYWYEEGFKTFTTFEAGKTYIACIFLEAETGYKFAGNATTTVDLALTSVTVNGDAMNPWSAPSQINETGYTYVVGTMDEIQTTKIAIYYYIEMEGITVSFETDGGSEIDAQCIASGANITYPAIPEKEGYTFDGWYADEELTTPWDFANASVTEDTTVYAKWAEVDAKGACLVTKSITLDPGKSVSVPVQIRNNPGIAGLSFTVEYDKEVLTLTNVEFGEWEGETSFNDDAEKNPVGIALIAPENYTKNGEIVNLTFEVASTAKSGDKVELKFHEINATDDRLNHVSVYSTVQDTLYGDVNRDGVIDISDSVLLAQHLAEWEVDPDLLAADCNGDGVVDISDAVLLAQYLAEWDVTLGGDTPVQPGDDEDDDDDDDDDEGEDEDKIPDIEIEASEL